MEKEDINQRIEGRKTKEEHIKKFENQIEKLTKTVKGDLLLRELDNALERFLKDFTKIWSKYRQHDYILTTRERESVYTQLEEHQQKIDELLEKIGLKENKDVI